MRKCKRQYCNEPAVPYGKQLCQKHTDERKAKQREYLRIQTTLPECDTRIIGVCNGKVDKRLTTCVACTQYLDDERAAVDKRNAAIDAFAYAGMRNLKQNAFTPEQLDQLRDAFVAMAREII